MRCARPRLRRSGELLLTTRHSRYAVSSQTSHGWLNGRRRLIAPALKFRIPRSETGPFNVGRGPENCAAAYSSGPRTKPPRPPPGGTLDSRRADEMVSFHSRLRRFDSLPEKTW